MPNTKPAGLKRTPKEWLRLTELVRDILAHRKVKFTIFVEEINVPRESNDPRAEYQRAYSWIQRGQVPSELIQARIADWCAEHQPTKKKK